MWCITTRRTCSCSPRASSRISTGRSVARSKRWAASAATIPGRVSAVAGTIRRSSWTSSSGMMCWYGVPPWSGKRVRRLSCRCTTSVSASFRAAWSTSPVSRTASGMLYVADGPSICARNHSRCWAKDKGITWSLPSGASAAEWASRARRCRACRPASPRSGFRRGWSRAARSPAPCGCG